MSGFVAARLWAAGATLAAPALRLWLHAASVGETVSALPLVASLGRQDPDLNFLITTGTVTSAQLLQDRLPGLELGFRARHRFVPLDVPAWVRRFLEHWRPDLAAFVESELWPNLIAAAAARGIPLALVNARLSAGSYRRWRLLAPGLARRMLQRFSLVAARSEEDAERLSGLERDGIACALPPRSLYLFHRAIRTFGRSTSGHRTPGISALPTGRIEAPGDLKLAAPPLPVDQAERVRIEAALENRPRWLAASTHPGEEEIAADVHRRLSAEFPGLVTIIAPRHPDRGEEIARQLGAFAPKRRAIGEDPPAGGIWIADTLGELGLFYRLAPVAFIGKSLSGRGGQNPFEAARLGAAIAVGPHTGNFQVAVGRLEARGALARVADGDALAGWVGGMLRDPAKARAAGEAALAATAADAGMPDRLAARLLALMDRAPADRAKGS